MRSISGKEVWEKGCESPLGTPQFEAHKAQLSQPHPQGAWNPLASCGVGYLSPAPVQLWGGDWVLAPVLPWRCWMTGPNLPPQGLFPRLHLL